VDSKVVDLKVNVVGDKLVLMIGSVSSMDVYVNV